MNEVPQMGTLASNRTLTSDGSSALQDPASPIQRGFREREVMQVLIYCVWILLQERGKYCLRINFCYNSFLQAVGQLGDANEVLNERAVAVMARMKYKLFFSSLCFSWEFNEQFCSGGSNRTKCRSRFGNWTFC